MKIIYDYSIFAHQSLGGISRYYINLDQLIKKKNKSIILAPIHFNQFLNSYKDYKGTFINKFPKFTSKIFKFYNNTMSNKFLSNFKPDIFHKTYYNDYFPKNFSGKKIITVYDLIHEKFYKDYNFKENYRPKTKQLENSDIIIAISNKTKSDLIEYYNISPKKIFVTHLGINSLPNKSKYNIINQPYILFVGDRKRYKNFSNLLKAYSISKKINNNFKLVLFGGGDLFESEKEIIKKYRVSLNSIIQISGADENLSTLYRFSSLFIFPSKYEGFGLPLLEAASLKCPVACSDIEVFREIMDDGAYYFNPYSVDDIIDKLEKILLSSSLKKDLVLRASERVSNFSWEKCSNATLKIYKE